jgi:hypothetical protein
MHSGGFHGIQDGLAVACKGYWLGLRWAFLFPEKGKCSRVLPFLMRLLPCFLHGVYGSAKIEIVFKLLAISC